MEENTVQEQPIAECREYSDYASYRSYLYFVRRRQPMAWLNWFAAYCFGPTMSAYLISKYLWYIRLIVFGWLTVVIPLFVIVSLFLIIYMISEPRRLFKRGPGRSPFTSITSFYEDRYTFVTTGDNTNLNGSVSYNRIVSTYETKTAFYIKSDVKGYGFFPKKYFTPEQIDALRELFTRKFGEKFKQYKQK